jgi:hypothetical protein
MGVPVALAAGAAAASITQAVIEVNEKLNTPRTCVLEVKNHTGLALSRISHDHAHGGFGVPPNETLPARTAEVFGSQSAAFSVGTGTEGRVTYRATAQDALATIRWSVPFIGDNGCGGATGGWYGTNHLRLSCLTGAGNDAHMKYELHEDGPGPVSFGQQLGKVDDLTLIQSNYGNNLELIARAGDALHFMWRDTQWHGPHRIAGGAAGNPVLIQSRFGRKGNFELVYPDRERGIRFMWRNNDA